ncbi:MAG: 30S ribosomal protein S12 methylthiotransferase RimO [Oscillospiraceae bacterium]|nr:30S ribosomal protein S12 methylthiotransferase RimO [Oscillospiraceae bacterium]
MANIYFISLGCDKNRIDAELMCERLISAGHNICTELEKCEAAVVNTCGFIESAQKEAIDNIFDMARSKERGEIRALIVTGCLAQRYGRQLREQLPEVDAALGLAYNTEIADAVERALAGERFERFGRPEELIINGQRALSTPQHYAYIKLAEGCSNHCTYCAIPSIRGRFRSRPMEEIISEARGLAERGVRELIAVAQDTTSYGSDLYGKPELAALLKRLCDEKLFWRIRLLYAYPERINGELIELLAAERGIAAYFDIPLQHASAEVLKRMGRSGSGEDYLRLIERLRYALPEISLRSSFIVGFPGETEAQFEELLAFIKSAKLERAGCFAFSAEEGTAAARLKGQLPEEIKLERTGRFNALRDELLHSAQREKVGGVFEAVCDGYDEEHGMFSLRGDSDAPEIDSCIYAPLECDMMPGEIYRMKIIAAEGAELIGEPVY